MTRETIVKAVSDLIDADFVPTITQNRQLKNPKNSVSRILEGLPKQIKSLVSHAARAVEGLEPVEIPPRMVASALVLDNYISGFSSNKKDYIIEDMTVQDVFQLGYAEGIREAGPENEIENLYRTILKRSSDKEGFNIWTKELRNGMPLPIIAHYFVHSEEAKNANK